MPNSQPWDGVKRRSDDYQPDDHDKVIRLIEIVANQSATWSNHVVSYQKHLEDDKQSFKEINESLSKLVNMKYLMLGAFIVVQIALKFLLKI